MNYFFPKENRERWKEWLLLVGLTLFYFAMLFVSFMVLLADKRSYLVGDFSPAKTIVAILFTLAILLTCNQFKDKPSVFLFNLLFFTNYIPMGVIYGTSNYSTAFFLLVSALFYLLALGLNLGDAKGEERVTVIPNMNHLIMVVSIFCLGFVVLYSLYNYGLPSLRAFDLEGVYDIRGTYDFASNKYFGYLFRWTVTVIAPFMAAVFFSRKNYVGVMVLLIVVVGLYLWSAQKTILFSIPLILIAWLFSGMENASHRFFSCYSLGVSLVCVAGILGVEDPHSYLVRRALMIPANLKFLYYEYFLDHERIGLAGTLWGSILGKESPYPRGVGREISSCYFKDDSMNSNTGFIGEGFSRFGILGVIIAMAIVFLVLLAIDRLALRSSPKLAIIASVYPIYMLNDGQLIDSIIFGPMLIFMLIVLFYSEYSLKEIYHEGKIQFKIC